MSNDFGGVSPILVVRDLAASLDHYVRVLGFSIDWNYEHTIASVTRGRCTIFLSEGDQGQPGAWVWIGVSDCASLHDELRARGATIRHPPTNYTWALEMQVEDPDGNVLRIGSDPRENEPHGEWLDAKGMRWRRTDEGWERVEE